MKGQFYTICRLLYEDMISKKINKAEYGSALIKLAHIREEGTIN